MPVSVLNIFRKFPIYVIQDGKDATEGTQMQKGAPAVAFLCKNGSWRRVLAGNS